MYIGQKVKGLTFTKEISQGGVQTARSPSWQVESLSEIAKFV